MRWGRVKGIIARGRGRVYAEAGGWILRQMRRVDVVVVFDFAIVDALASVVVAAPRNTVVVGVGIVVASWVPIGCRVTRWG
jgi:hypothetical protein